MAANMTDKDAAFKPSGVSPAPSAKPILSERFSAEADGGVRFGPWGFVVLPM